MNFMFTDEQGNIKTKNIVAVLGSLALLFYIYKSAIGEGVLIQNNGVNTRRNIMIWVDVLIACGAAFFIIKYSRTLIRSV